MHTTQPQPTTRTTPTQTKGRGISVLATAAHALAIAGLAVLAVPPAAATGSDSCSDNGHTFVGGTAYNPASCWLDYDCTVSSGCWTTVSVSLSLNAPGAGAAKAEVVGTTAWCVASSNGLGGSCPASSSEKLYGTGSLLCRAVGQTVYVGDAMLSCSISW